MSKDVAKQNEQGEAPDRVETARGARIYRPATDICETENAVVIAIDMPGAGPEDVEITLENRVLTIHGRGHQTRPDGYRPVYVEYGEGDYERAFSLSEEIDEAGIKAAVHGGVLMLELPKAAPARPKRIKVKAA
jgi:HSP20 family molecular chaperone IbpA